MQKPKNNGLNGRRDVACLLDLWLWSKGVRTDPLGARFIVQEWHKELGGPEMEAIGDNFSDLGSQKTETLTQLEEEEILGANEGNQKKAEWLRLAGHVMLVSAGKLQTC